MFKVECPGCNAPYQVDERRVPTSGLKMRCPKCGTSFKVDPPPDGRRTSAGPGPAGLPAQPQSSEDRAVRNAGMKSTIVGVAAPGIAPVSPPRPAQAGYGDIDLPSVGAATRARSAAASPTPDESDLPSARALGTQRIDLPAAAAPKPPRREAAPPLPGPPPRVALDFGEIDLPASIDHGAQAGSYGEEADLPTVGPAERTGRIAPSSDLPAVSSSKGASGFGEIDLPSALPSSTKDGRATPAGRPSRDDYLPAALDFAGLPETAAGLPARAGDLPSTAAGLPSPAAALPMRGAGLPSPSTASNRPGLPMTAAGLPLSARELPSALGNLAEFPPDSLAPPAPEPMRSDSFGELELPLTGAAPVLRTVDPAADLEVDPFARSAPQPSGRPLVSDPSIVRLAGGGVSYGEVNLDSADGAARSSSGLADDMEFGAIPEEAAKLAAPAQAAAVTRPQSVPMPGVRAAASDALPRKRRGLRIGIGLVALFAIGGGALALVPSVGPFGAYWISDRLKGGEYQQLVSSSVVDARSHMAADTYPEAQRALQGLEAAHANARRVEALAGYTSFVGYARELRFGSEPEVRARAQVLLDELKETREMYHVELARAAQGIVLGQLTRARQKLQALARDNAGDPDVFVAQGELELRAREPAAALSAWQAAAALERSPRTDFGLARAKYAAGNLAGAESAAHGTLQKNPEHVGARILIARVSRGAGDKEASSIKMLQEVVTNPSKASPEEIVGAQTLLGDIHLTHSRISQAEAAYGEALKINPKAARALVGLGEVLYRASRYSEALARFEAGMQADPDELAAKIGVAKTTLSLERLREAESMLKTLREAQPKSMLIAFWFGKVLDALGLRKQAEEQYRTALQLGGSDAETVDAYVALSLLQSQQGQTAEAQKTLAEARAKLRPSSRMHNALGELALAQGRHADAISEFRASLKLDRGDANAKFRLGVALRRNRNLDEARNAFDEVADLDRDYPGLALERGLLHEASGHTEEALKAYESALAKAPNDPDLMLRVGCGKVAAGGAAQAVELLRRVLNQRQTSAETNHCLGRALLVQGTNLADALRALERATELDANRAEYWLYVGWAANEAGRVVKAEDALKKALELDQNLADAYWQRGVLRARQGAVKDAVKDLEKALELRPSRYEAHAALADAYDDLRLEPAALAEWDKAVAAQPDNALWRFRYGKLLATHHRNDVAREQLGKAIAIGEQADPKPIWLSEAHLQLARALGMRPEAIEHWEAFLKIGSRDSAYRSEAKEMLKKLGRPWDGD